MADTPSIPNDSPANGETAPAPGTRRSLLGRLAVLGFIALVIAAECGVAYLYLPSSSEAAAMAGATSKTAESEPEAIEEEPEEHATPAQSEVDLGEYSVTAFQPTSNSTLRIDFHLFGTVRASEAEDFARLMEENKHRIREQVLVTVRSAEITDLADASLGLLKRQILDKTNRTLGKPLLREVIISDFSFVEQ